MKDTTKLERFVVQNPNAELHGFFDRGEDGKGYRVIILARVANQKGRNSEAAEFVGSNPAQLVSAAWKAGYEIGDGPTVAALCESAPRSRPKQRPRGAA